MKPWGNMSQEDVAACIAAPAGKAVDIIRKYDPAWGCSGQGKAVFEVTITKRITTVEQAKVRVVAEDEDAAEKVVKADRGNWHKLDFKDVDGADDEEIFVDDVELTEDLP